ncbi:hypothetical protein LCGC14_0862810 [marine sediment metagenome]|uniref:Uncharacterized protein n=1 Tax=marine sediment metagenome TaxID=412755 RepID=A0A0F9PBZ1_9ZZZZ
MLVKKVKQYVNLSESWDMKLLVVIFFLVMEDILNGIYKEMFWKF